MQLRPVQEVRWPPPPQRRTARRLLLVVLPLLLATAAGYSTWWYVATGQMRDRADAWIEGRRAAGWQIGYAEAGRAGFPFRVAVRFEAVSAASSHGGVRWQGERVRLSAPPFAAQTLRLDVEGEQTLGFDAGAGSHQGRREWRGRAETFAFKLRPGTGWLPNGRLKVRELGAAGGTAGESLGVARLELESRGDPAASTGPDTSGWAMALTADGVRLPPEIGAPFGRELARLALDARLMGPLQGHPWPASLEAWRTAGGVLEVTRVVLAGGPVTLDAEGTLALDKGGQPMAAMTARVQGYEQALDRLAAERALPMHTAAAAKILLRAQARSGAQGPTLVAPITLQDRTLFIGPVPLLQVPEVRWLDAAPAGRRG